MKKYCFQLISHEGSTPEKFSIQLNGKDIDLLKKYIKNCDRLLRAEIFTDGFPILKQISFKQDEGIEIEVSKYSYSNVCELLHLARPFFLKKEPASFDRIKSLFGKNSEGSCFRKYLKYLGDLYEQGIYQKYFQISIGDLDEQGIYQKYCQVSIIDEIPITNEIPIFHDNTIKLWLNGVEYHQDIEKAEKISRLEKVLSEDTMRGLFVSHLLGRMKAVFLFGELARPIVKEIN